MANGLEKERTLVDALRKHFNLATNDLWDSDFGIDVAVLAPKGALLLRAPLAVQITWRRGNWNKRGMTFEKAGQIADRIVLIEIDSRDVTDLVVHGITVALNHLFMSDETPRHVIIEVAPNGHYHLTDFEARLQELRRLLEEKITGNISGPLTFWNGEFGFIEAEVSGEGITFFAHKSQLHADVLRALEGINGPIEEGRGPTTIFEDGGVNQASAFRKIANNIRMA